MTNIEAMKLALDALEMAYELDDTGFADFKKYGLKVDKDITKKLLEAIAALRQAISVSEEHERQRQAAGKWRDGYTQQAISEAEQAEHGPVAWGANWSVFNSGGACEGDGLTLEEAKSCFTESRFKRGWTAVHCVVVHSDNEWPNTAPPKAEQEPVAGLFLGGIENGEYGECEVDPWMRDIEDLQKRLVKDSNPVRLNLYTTPPQREWASLNLTDREKIRDQFEGCNYPASLLSVVDAMLKEKNNV